MLIKQIAGVGPGTTNVPDDVWVSIKNTTGGALSQGYLVCFNVTNVSSANGLDVEKPLTSALPAFTGVVDRGDGTTSYSIADKATGLAKTRGVVDTFFRAESNGGAQVEGTALGPVTGQWYAQSNGTSYAFGPLILMSRLAANTFESRIPMYVRAL